MVYIVKLNFQPGRSPEADDYIEINSNNSIMGIYTDYRKALIAAINYNIDNTDTDRIDTKNLEKLHLDKIIELSNIKEKFMFKYATIVEQVIIN